MGSRGARGATGLWAALGVVLVLAGGAYGVWRWRTRARITCPAGLTSRELANPDGSREWRCLSPTGVRQGPAITYDAAGRKRQLDHFDADRLEGVHRAWSPEGTLVEEGEYRKGLRQGSWIIHDPKTQVETNSIYEAGKRIGQSIAYFRNGQMKEQATYKDDVLSGEYTSYFLNGKVEWTGRYLAGKQVGVWKHFDSFGNLIDRIDHGGSSTDEGASPEAPPAVSLAGKELFAGRPLDWWKTRLAHLAELKKSRPELAPLVTLTVERARMTGLIVEPTSSGFEVAPPSAP